MSKYIRLDEATDLFRGIDATMTGSFVADTLESLPTLEVSDDCISRDYVRLIESDEDAYYGDWNETYERGFSDAIDKVLNAPSVVPSRAEGEWKFKKIFPNDDSEFPMGYLVCSVCGSQHANATPCNYCDNCGAKMKGADDD